MGGVCPPVACLSNGIVYALDLFRSKERLPLSFLTKCLLPHCPELTVGKIRNKVDSSLKRTKLLKSRKLTRDLEQFLGEPFIDPQESTIPNEKERQCFNCKTLVKENKNLEFKLNVANDTTKQLSSQIQMLLKDRDNVTANYKAIDECNKKYKDIQHEMRQLKKKNLDLQNELEENERSKLYNKIKKLKKEAQKCRDQVTAKDIQLMCQNQRITFFERTIYDLNAKVKSEQTLKSNYKKKYEGEKAISEAYANLLKDEEEELVTREAKHHRFTPEVRMTVMQLQGEADVSAKKCSKVIEIISNTMFGTDLSSQDLPCTQTSLNIADEAHHVATAQIGDELLKAKHFTFASDGTSRQKQHYLENHIYLDNGKVLSLGFQEVETDDALTLLEKTVEILKEISQIHSESKQQQDKDEIFREILRKMQCMMSDRAANMKAFNKKVNDLKTDVVGEELSTNFLYCNAHFLLGLVSGLEKALKQVESSCGVLGRDRNQEFASFASNTEPAAIRIIRMCAEVFGPRGDEKNGCRQDWLAYLESVGHSSKLTSHRGNRFNNIFDNAAAVMYHREHMKKFISKCLPRDINRKLISIRQDLEDNKLMSLVAAIASFNALFTLPYWKLMNSKTSYGAFAPFVQAMDDVLQRWCESYEFDNMPHNIFLDFFVHDQYTSEFLTSSLDCHPAIAQELFQELSKESRVVLKRQLKDFLQDGVFFDTPEQVAKVLNTCPLTNLVGERLFGDLDFDMSKRRRCSTHHRSTINMWRHNKTAAWLRKQSDKSKQEILARAALKASCLRMKDRDDEKEVRRRRKAKLVKNAEAKVERELKGGALKASMLDKIISSDGVCTSKEDLDYLFKSGTAEDLRTQIRYRKIILCEKGLKLNGSKKLLYDRLLTHVQGMNETNQGPSEVIDDDIDMELDSVPL